MNEQTKREQMQMTGNIRAKEEAMKNTYKTKNNEKTFYLNKVIKFGKYLTMITATSMLSCEVMAFDLKGAITSGLTPILEAVIDNWSAGLTLCAIGGVLAGQGDLFSRSIAVGKGMLMGLTVILIAIALKSVGVSSKV